MEGILLVAPGVEVLKRVSRKGAPERLTRLCVFAIFAPLREISFSETLTIRQLTLYPPPSVMSQSLHRYYYYYGPLSDGRDGQAMGCRRALTM